MINVYLLDHFLSLFTAPFLHCPSHTFLNHTHLSCLLRWPDNVPLWGPTLLFSGFLSLLLINTLSSLPSTSIHFSHSTTVTSSSVILLSVSLREKSSLFCSRNQLHFISSPMDCLSFFFSVLGVLGLSDAPTFVPGLAFCLLLGGLEPSASAWLG